MCFHISSPLSNLPIGFGDMIKGFKDLLPKDISKGLPPIRGSKHHIDFTLGETLPNRVAYRANPKVSKEIQQVLSLLKRVGPVKDRIWLMCMDYQPINAITTRYKHLIPRLDDVLDELHRSSVFSKIDLRNEYHQI
ncbi:hypothetical protein CR513_27464, partial [Mucuna pruriens]